MANYANISDLEAYGSSSEWLSGATSDQKFNAIARASSVADGYLAARYTLPLTAWGPDLRGIVVDIAVYYLLTGAVGFNPNADADRSIIDRYTAAIGWLKDLAKSVIHPTGVTDSSSPPETTSLTVYAEADAPRGW